MSKKNSKPGPEEHYSEETEKHLAKLDRLEREQAEAARKVELIQSGINAVGTCLTLSLRVDPWQPERETAAEWRKRRDWKKVATGWVEQILLMTKVVERVARQLEVQPDFFFKHTSSRTTTVALDPAAFMEGIVARLRAVQSDKKKVAQIKLDLEGVLRRDSDSLQAYEQYFRCVEDNLAEAAKQLFRRVEPPVEQGRYGLTGSEHRQTTASNMAPGTDGGTAPHDQDFASIDERLLGKDADRAKKVVGKLRAFPAAFITSQEVDTSGLSSKSLRAHAVSQDWKAKGRMKHGDGVDVYSKKHVVEYVSRVWRPKRRDDPSSNG